MIQVSQEYAMVDIEQIAPHPRNPRRGDMTAINESISENGFYGVIVVQRSTGQIIVGNHRYRAAVEQGAEKVPVIFVDVDDDRALKIMLADNAANDRADYDTRELVDLLQGLDEDDSLAGSLYSESDLEELAKQLSANEPGESRLSGDQSGEIKERFEVLVECRDELHQRELLTMLSNLGETCRALIS